MTAGPGPARLLLYAPNVHTGGGAVLLGALLASLPAGVPVMAWLDARARSRWTLPAGMQVRWVRASLADRATAEWSLKRSAQSGDRVLCFHGLPPLFRSAGSVQVFQQNRLYLGQMPLLGFAWKTRLRLAIEMQIHRRCRGHVDGYWVQTSSMAQALHEWGAGSPLPPVHVLGFAPARAHPTREAAQVDFVYVADGEAHKNHRRLIEAWVLLAAEGLRPSLALTLKARDHVLRGWAEQQASRHGLDLRWLPPMSHDEVLALYGRAGALVFPSLGESYGLPLLEATAAGLPIVAGELDYVRDVCVPAQSFDPHSSRSIARAIKRQLGLAERPEPVHTAAAFWAALLGRALV